MYSLIQLEFDKIKEMLANRCHSEQGQQLAYKLTPILDKSIIEASLDLISEIGEMLRNGNDHNFEKISDLTDLLEKHPYETYSFEEFRRIYFNQTVTNRIVASRKFWQDNPEFCKLADLLQSNQEIEDRFEQIFTPEGDVKDTASSQLQKLRRRKKQVRTDIVSLLTTKLEDYSGSNYLHDKIITQRDGRFVIPLKEGAISFVSGIVHGKSASRSSVYLEPADAVPLNNEMDLIDSDEKEEIYRICKEFTAQIRNFASALKADSSILIKFDFFFAAARLANYLKAEKPVISETPILQLREARHPLLIEAFGDISKVVPFDLDLGTDSRILLISGPNTGGKTVTMKTAGLLSLMALSGLPVPAREDSRIGIFHHILADIGDNQSLESSLSTFSSHIRNIGSMIANGDDHTLVLIDEIGAATDPEQGSALAQAILEKLISLEVTGIITTHYTALKIFAEQNDFCQNAAMQFDSDKHLPTYHFKAGLPGNSFAIEVAAELGLPDDLIDQAKTLAGSQNIEMTELLDKMTREKNELGRQNYQYQLKTSLLNQKIQEHQIKIDALEKEARQIRKKSLQEARDYLINLQRELNSELNQLKKTDKQKRKNQLEQVLSKTRKITRKITETEEELTPQDREELKQAKIGKIVWVKDFETEGEIVEIRDEVIKVNINGFFYTTDRKKLFEIRKTASESLKKGKITVPKRTARIELKLLGLRFEEALPELENFLDDACLNGLEFVRVVHGKGTGALRSKIRQYLRTDKRISEFHTPPPEAG
ncbi:MAG: endonuclease MutS2, partial [Candidatus Cloacimonetes bacterium]|nr:endonuclease MutS2 [Candidatus Cloacimonadota bacterium]